MHAVGMVEMFSGNYEKAAQALGEWNQFHPQSLWSYVKHAVALSLAGRCDESGEQLAIVEQQTGGRMSSLMSSWIGWAYELCGRKDDYQRMKENVLAVQQQRPGKIDPALIWFYMTEGDKEKAIELMQAIAEEKHPATLFMPVYSLDVMSTPEFGGVQDDPRYLQILADLDFPPID